jgi:hypothetical protein
MRRFADDMLLVLHLILTLPGGHRVWQRDIGACGISGEGTPPANQSANTLIF